ncbi:MAG: NADP-specific glutamate dehydrogenase [Eubacteriaceae bacterium]|nr:NADP-specific glutamate dehydrogenase [Eubacteriaceae bacterium]
MENERLKEIYESVKKRNPLESEFLQAVSEVFTSLIVVAEKYPMYARAAIFERLVEPDRMIMFRVPWMDDMGNIRVNRGYRVQFNNAIGPYKGGLRFHPMVNLSVMKALGFEQTFKNSLSGLPIGGAKGGSDFDPKGKSEGEVMRFCQSFMTELFKYVGPDEDVPAGDQGVGAREIGYLFGQYKRLTGQFHGVLTGKGIPYSGSLARTEATGYGLIYFVREMLKSIDETLYGKTAVISGSGNVAIYAAVKATALGACVVAMSDSGGYIYDEQGIDTDTIRLIKEKQRGRISEYIKYRPKAKYFEGSAGIWGLKCDLAMPCATQNELNAESAAKLIENGCRLIAEGSNMSCTQDAIALIKKAGLLYSPGKASNAGGVSVSALEMTQNSMRYSWSFEEVDAKLEEIMKGIYKKATAAAKEFGRATDLEFGANVAAFIKVADAMMAQGCV